MKRTLLFAAVLLGTATATTNAHLITAPVAVAIPPWGINLSIIDSNVKPGDDFFAYANNGWLKTAKIPDDRSSAGVNLELNLQNEARLKTIVKDLTTRKNITAEQKKLCDFYHAYMDQNQIETAGLTPALADLKKIAALKTRDDIARAMGNPALALDGPFSTYFGVDDKHPTRYSVNLYQSGLGLPDRDYYLRVDKEFAATRNAYQKYLALMLTFTGVKDADVRAAAILKLENDIARVHWPAAERRNAEKIYNPLTMAELKTLAPQFPWDAFFVGSGIPATSSKGMRTVIVAEKSAFPKLADVFAATPVSVWRDYLTVRYLHAYAEFLPKKIDDADFVMYGKIIQGNRRQLDRQTRAIKMLDTTLGEILGKEYAARYFPPSAKSKAKQLIDNLLTAYEMDIKTLDWMTPATRAKAINKLHHYMLKIGYPDHWRDYSALLITRHNLLQDAKNANVFSWHHELNRIDDPVERNEWSMTPPTNNAYYNSCFNEIVFPAGILQPPFFDPNADDAVNYGAIGATIGHEISHGFDDQGSKYDADGALRDWWTRGDRKNFDARTAALAKQYDQYEPLLGIHINGRLTLGENIADLAGLVIAYKAYHLSLQGKPAPLLNGYTGDQRFYLAYAQSWRQINRKGIARERLLSNPHSPESYRVNGVVRNDDGWYAAFPNIKAGDKYYLPQAQRVHLW